MCDLDRPTAAAKRKQYLREARNETRCSRELRNRLSSLDLSFRLPREQMHARYFPATSCRCLCELNFRASELLLFCSCELLWARANRRRKGSDSRRNQKDDDRSFNQHFLLLYASANQATTLAISETHCLRLPDSLFFSFIRFLIASTVNTSTHVSLAFLSSEHRVNIVGSTPRGRSLFRTQMMRELATAAFKSSIQTLKTANKKILIYSFIGSR